MESWSHLHSHLLFLWTAAILRALLIMYSCNCKNTVYVQVIKKVCVEMFPVIYILMCPQLNVQNGYGNIMKQWIKNDGTIVQNKQSTLQWTPHVSSESHMPSSSPSQYSFSSFTISTVRVVGGAYSGHTHPLRWQTLTFRRPFRHEPGQSVEGEGVGVLALLSVAVKVRVLLTDGMKETNHFQHQLPTGVEGRDTVCFTNALMGTWLLIEINNGN